MSSPISFESAKARRAAQKSEDKTKSREVVAMRHIDLDTVIETVRVLRLMDDRSLLDKYNQRNK